MTDEEPDRGESAPVAAPVAELGTGRPLRTRRKNARALTVVRGVGQTFITAGLVILLFVVYEVWVTNIFAHYKQQKVENDLVQEYAQGKDPLAQATLPGGGQQAIPIGTGIANLYIPRLGDDYHFAIVQGTDDASLDKGPGHYTNTALPGQKGNFSVAGHRVGKGEPFLNLDQLQAGDAVVVETKDTWYIYRVFGDAATNNLSVTGATAPPGAVVASPPPTQALAAKVVGREIVKPSDGDVILPVPNDANVTAAQASGYLLTLTTCHPKFTADKRMIIHGYLARTVPRVATTSGKADQLPRELDGGTL
jgi:sortase A